MRVEESSTKTDCESLLKRVAAIGTEGVVGRDKSSAMRTGLSLLMPSSRERSARIIDDGLTVFADPEGNSFFYWEEWDEKKAEVVIDSLLTDFRMTTDRTDSVHFSESDFLGLNTAYEKKHGSIPFLPPAAGDEETDEQRPPDDSRDDTDWQFRRR